MPAARCKRQPILDDNGSCGSSVAASGRQAPRQRTFPARQREPATQLAQHAQQGRPFDEFQQPSRSLWCGSQQCAGFHQQFAVLHLRRAHRFAVQTVQAVVQVRTQFGGGVGQPAGQRGGDRNAPARAATPPRCGPAHRWDRPAGTARTARIGRPVRRCGPRARAGGLFKQPGGHAIIANSQLAGRWACAVDDGSAIISRLCSIEACLLESCVPPHGGRQVF